MFLLFSFALQGQIYTADPLYKTADEWYEEHSPYSSLPGYVKPNPRKAPIDTKDGKWIIGDDTDNWVYYLSNSGKYYRQNKTTGEWQYFLIIGSFFGTWISTIGTPNIGNLNTYANYTPLGGETLLFLFCSIYIFRKWKRKRKLTGEELHGEPST